MNKSITSLSDESANPINTLPDKPPIVEIATYSDVEVFESYFKGFESRIIMRRIKDDWVNVTQAFKIAKFSKTKRTRILEKESNFMRHEKVQGGYGRFQGTWVPLDDAKRIVSKYDIDDPLINTLLNFQYDPNNPPYKRSKNSVLRRASPGTVISSPSSYHKTPKRSISNTNKKIKSNHINTINSNNSNSTINPSPLQNITFQTPQQYNSNLTGSFNFKRTDTTNSESTIPDASNSTLKVNPNLNHSGDMRTIHGVNNTNNQNTLIINNSINNNNSSTNKSFHEDLNSIPKELYSTTQKPLQFYPMAPNTNSEHIKNIPTLSNFVTTQDNSNKDHNGGKRKLKNKVKISTNNISFVNQTTRETNKNKNDKSVYEQEHEHYREIISTVQKNNKNKQNQSSGRLMNMNNNNDNFMNNNNNHVSNVFLNGEMQGSIFSQSHLPLSEPEYKQIMLKLLATEKVTDETKSMLDSLSILPPNFNINYEIDDQGHSALHWAAAMGNISLIHLLLQLNVNILNCNNLGFNCITKAVFYNNCYNQRVFNEIINILNVCLLTPDVNGRLPVHYLVELSVNQSKDPQIINSYMDSILTTIGNNNFELLRTCLNYPDNIGNTVLHLAALNQNFELCSKLYNLGSSMEVINLNNETPASILAKYDMVPASSSKVNIISSMMVPPPPLQQLQQPHHAQQRQQQQEQFSQQISEPPQQFPQPPSRPPSRPVVYNSNITHQNTNHLANMSLEQVQTVNVPVQSTVKKEFNPIVKNQNQNDSIPSSLEDMSTTLDTLMVSTVLKDSKVETPNLLEQSPMLYKDKAFFHDSTVKDTLSTPRLAPLEQTKNRDKEVKIKSHNQLETVLESPELLLPDSLSPREGKKDVKSATQRLRDITNQITYKIDRNIDTLTLKMDALQSEINRNKQKYETIKYKRDTILKDYDNNEEKIKRDIGEVKESVVDYKSKYVQCIEKSQALRLATLVQDEESSIKEDKSDDSDVEDKEGKKDCKIQRVAIELTKLQLKRRATLKCICNNRTDYRVTEKISKYRYLIGMTIDDIDSRLDDIENDLKETNQTK